MIVTSCRVKQTRDRYVHYLIKLHSVFTHVLNNC